LDDNGLAAPVMLAVPPLASPKQQATGWDADDLDL
jgi:hypothetical protein